MSRPTGLKKTGGRKVGTPNLRSRELQDRIEELLGGDDLPGAILSKVKKLSAEKQVELLMGLMPYVYSKRKAIELESKNQFTFTDYITFADKLGELNYEDE